jgi:hypothetical protein
VRVGSSALWDPTSPEKRASFRTDGDCGPNAKAGLNNLLPLRSRIGDEQVVKIVTFIVYRASQLKQPMGSGEEQRSLAVTVRECPAQRGFALNEQMCSEVRKGAKECARERESKSQNRNRPGGPGPNVSPARKGWETWPRLRSAGGAALHHPPVPRLWRSNSIGGSMSQPSGLG